ncbi:MAG: hypothetical protein JO322_04245 [Candidatus Eremiobacteraeota bacterium]|nr:hypothetical protein [Candidatus Eremiobacteraeota bacterium]
MKHYIPALTIPARTYNSDCTRYEEFDASDWFEDASAESILQLAENGWSTEHVGFRYEVDRVAALEWLAFVRPGVLAEIRRRAGA